MNPNPLSEKNWTVRFFRMADKRTKVDAWERRANKSNKMRGEVTEIGISLPTNEPKKFDVLVRKQSIATNGHFNWPSNHLSEERRQRKGSELILLARWRWSAHHGPALYFCTLKIPPSEGDNEGYLATTKYVDSHLNLSWKRHDTSSSLYKPRAAPTADINL